MAGNKYSIFSHKKGSLKPSDRYMPKTVTAKNKEEAKRIFKRKRPNAVILGVNKHPKKARLSTLGGRVYD